MSWRGSGLARRGVDGEAEGGAVVPEEEEEVGEVGVVSSWGVGVVKGRNGVGGVVPLASSSAFERTLAMGIPSCDIDGTSSRIFDLRDEK